MSANGCIATVCRSGIYIARRSLTTQDVSKRKSTTNVWIVQVNTKNYYINNERSSAADSGACYAQSGALRHYMPNRAKYVLSIVYLSYMFRISFVYVPYIYRSW